MENAPKLHVVTGKGGVGKTSVACALALAHAQRGRRVLLAEFNGGDRVADALGVAPVGYAMREVLPRLWAIDLTPEASLREYVLLTIKVQAIYRAVFEGKLVSSFLRLLPALGELTMLGKVWYEYVQRDGKRPRFDVIVLDAPATGHARALLLAPKAVMDSVPKGPMRDNAQRIDDMLHAPNGELNIVTTAEAMPVAEAHELRAFAAAQGFAHCGVVANQVPGRSSPELIRFADHLAERAGPLQATGACLQRRAERARQGHEALATLRAQLTAELPAYPWDLPARGLIERMAADLAGVAQRGQAGAQAHEANHGQSAATPAALRVAPQGGGAGL